MYLVRSKALGELECENKGKPCFDGIVGKISGDDQFTSRESFLSQQRFLRLMPRPEAVPTGSPCQAVHDNHKSPAGVFFGIAFNSNFLMHASCIQSWSRAQPLNVRIKYHRLSMTNRTLVSVLAYARDQWLRHHSSRCQGRSGY